MFSTTRTDVPVRHDPRPSGKSGYSLGRILRLVFAILFSYSSFPLRAAALGGFVVAGLSFCLGLFYLVRGFFVESPVPGWTSIAVLLAISGCSSSSPWRYVVPQR